MNERILLVDDEEVLLMVIGDMLKYLGYRVEPKKNGKDALAAFLQNPSAFDLVITDYYMPEMRGIDLVRRILELRPEMPVIVMTGGDPDMEEEAMAVGVRKFILKPIGLDGFVETIRDAFRK